MMGAGVFMYLPIIIKYVNFCTVLVCTLCAILMIFTICIILMMETFMQKVHSVY